MNNVNEIDPRDFGHYMPGEWVAHTCCWMAWPCRKGMWADAAATQKDYANLANTIARFEPVRMLAPPHKVAEAKSLLGEGVEVVEMPIDDSWARDSGPIFLSVETNWLAQTGFSMPGVTSTNLSIRTH